METYIGCVDPDLADSVSGQSACPTHTTDGGVAVGTHLPAGMDGVGVEEADGITEIDGTETGTEWPLTNSLPHVGRLPRLRLVDLKRGAVTGESAGLRRPTSLALRLVLDRGISEVLARNKSCAAGFRDVWWCGLV